MNAIKRIKWLRLLTIVLGIGYVIFRIEAPGYEYTKSDKIILAIVSMVGLLYSYATRKKQ